MATRETRGRERETSDSEQEYHNHHRRCLLLFGLFCFAILNRAAAAAVSVIATFRRAFLYLVPFLCSCFRVFVNIHILIFLRGRTLGRT